MRQWLMTLRLLPIAIVLLIWGWWADHLEAVVTSLVGFAVGVVWDLVRARQERGEEVVPKVRVTKRGLLVAGFALAAFAIATLAGILHGDIPIGLVLIMLAMLAAGPILAFPFLIFYRAALARSKAAESWPSVPGTVENSFMQSVSVWPAPIVIYAYEVDGVAHRSTRARFGGTGAMNPKAAEELLARCPKGAEIPVYYDPRRPGRSVLVRTQDAPARNLLWGAGLVAAAPMVGAALIAILILIGLVDGVVTAVVGHRISP